MKWLPGGHRSVLPRATATGATDLQPPMTAKSIPTLQGLSQGQFTRTSRGDGEEELKES